ncbi:MAG: hypothetical protein JWM68_200 [Verrucomicrobiales bacterium]|nr:hypothetical protein [Verrucomicrobiales bacterium]
MAKSVSPGRKKKPTFARASDMINATNLAEDQVVDWFAVALEQWPESAEFKAFKQPKTKAEFQAALRQAFTAGWTAAEKQPQCSCGSPQRGGHRQGSALCMWCYERDDAMYYMQ